MKLLVTAMILRLLSINFPEVYIISFSPHFVLLSEPDDLQISKINCSLKLCEKIDRQNPAVVSRLELGYSLTDAIDKLLEMCAA